MAARTSLSVVDQFFPHDCSTVCLLQGALDEQRAMYEKKLAELRDEMASQQPSVAARESVSPESTPSESARGSKADILQ